VNQLGLNLKQTGLDAVEHSNLTWVEQMRILARSFSLGHGSVTADEVRGYAREMDWHPESPNAYGAVFRGEHWKAIGRTRSTWPGNHGRSICVWQWV